ncbi:MAG: DNA topoisomerase VI subunit B [Saccharolobus sp.]
MSVEKFTSLSPAEFFKRNPELVGFPNPARALYQTVRELVENSLDATDTHGILPNIKVAIDLVDVDKQIYKVIVSDNGIGIPPHEVPNAFGKVLYSSKYVNRQTRGMYGLGVKSAVLYSQMYQDKPIEIETSPINSKRIYVFKLKIDINRNEPIIVERRSVVNDNGSHGTTVAIYIPGDWSKAKSRIYEYIKRTYIITPYAEFIFKDPEDNVTYYARLTNKIPKPPQEVKPHPYGVDREEVKILINNLKRDYTIKEFLINEFQSIGETTASKILELVGLRSDKKAKNLNEEEITKLVDVMKKYEDFRPPSSDSLSVIGADLIELGLKKIFNPDFTAAVTRKPKVFQGHPFIVETGIAYGGSIPVSEEPIILRYANKIPLIYDEKSDVIWKVVEELDWKRYGIETEQTQMVILVHLCSTKIPYKSAGKESIAEVEDIEKEIKNGLMEVARKLKQYLSEKRKEEEAKKKLITYLKYIPEVGKSLAIFVTNGNKGDEFFKYQRELEDELFNVVTKKLNLADIGEYRKMYKVDSE